MQTDQEPPTHVVLAGLGTKGLNKCYTWQVRFAQDLPKYYTNSSCSWCYCKDLLISLWAV